jgi:Glycosyltransferase family 87
VQVVSSGQAVRERAGDLAAAPFPRSATTGLAGLLKRPASRWARVALVAVNLAAVTAFLLSYSRHGVGFGPYRIDLAAYRTGGRTWLRGEDLYGQVPVIRGLPMPFTYPPIAAVVLAPLALLPLAAAGTVLTTGSIALTALVLRLFLRRLAGPTAGSLWTAGWLLPAALLLEPVRSTLAYGQVNVLLMALVALDCLTAEPRWPRGALTGLAAAVKLTPALFVPWHAARVRGVAGLLGAVAQRLRRPAHLADVLVPPLGMVRASPSHPRRPRPPPSPPTGRRGRCLRPCPARHGSPVVAREVRRSGTEMGGLAAGQRKLLRFLRRPPPCSYPHAVSSPTNAGRRTSGPSHASFQPAGPISSNATEYSPGNVRPEGRRRQRSRSGGQWPGRDSEYPSIGQIMPFDLLRLIAAGVTPVADAQRSQLRCDVLPVNAHNSSGPTVLKDHELNKARARVATPRPRASAATQCEISPALQRVCGRQRVGRVYGSSRSGPGSRPVSAGRGEMAGSMMAFPMRWVKVRIVAWATRRKTAWSSPAPRIPSGGR